MKIVGPSLYFSLFRKCVRKSGGDFQNGHLFLSKKMSDPKVLKPIFFKKWFQSIMV